MSRQSHLRQTKSYGQKFIGRSTYAPQIQQESYPIQEPEQNNYNEPSSQASQCLFNKINKIFDDPCSFASDFPLEDKEETFYQKINYNPIAKTISESHKNTPSSVSNGYAVLNKAKLLLEKKQDEIPFVKERQKQKLKLTQKENTFVTGIGLYQDQEEDKKIPVKPDDKDDEINIHQDFDENEYVKDLKKTTEYDDLEELRRMIAATKKEIHGYAGEVVSLKNCINELNIGYKDSGLDIDEDLFLKIDRDYRRLGTSSGTRETKIQSLNTAKRNTLATAGSTASVSSMSTARRPPTTATGGARSSGLDRKIGSSYSMPLTNTGLTKLARVEQNQFISGTSKSSMRSTFYQ